MAILKLKEVCEELGVSRRAVQGYEKANLVHASSKNERGHLLYDETTQERIKLIKFYQDCGFEIKEIKELLNANSMVIKQKLIIRVKVLEEEKRRKEAIIQQVNEIIQSL